MKTISLDRHKKPIEIYRKRKIKKVIQDDPGREQREAVMHHDVTTRHCLK